MKVTLNKLHKYRSVVKSNLERPSLKKYLQLNLEDSVENCMNTVDIFEKEQQKQEQKFIDLSNDLQKIDTILFKANVESGLNTILHTITHKSSLLRMYLDLQDDNKPNSANPTYSNTSMLKHTLAQLKIEEKVSFLINLEIVSDIILQTKISDLRKAVRSLEDEKDRINNTFTVEISFSETSKNVIGL